MGLQGWEGPKCPRTRSGFSREGDLDGQEDVKTSGGGHRAGRSGEPPGLERGKLRRREAVCTCWTLLGSTETEESPCPKEVSL